LYFIIFSLIDDTLRQLAIADDCATEVVCAAHISPARRAIFAFACRNLVIARFW
jgi:hypothetical protein